MTAKKKAKTKSKKAKVKKSVNKKVVKKKSEKTKTVKKTKKKVEKKTSGKGKVGRSRKKSMKCCTHCPDYEYCDDRGFCCDYCDYYLNGKCMYGKKRGIPSLDEEIELPDYRGDDYGIDDYEAYESAYD